MAPSVSLIVFPVLAFCLLLLFGGRLSRFMVSFVGVGGIVLSCCAAVSCWLQYSGQSERQILWTFLPSELIFPSNIQFALLLDSLSLTMALVVTFVSTLIAIYSSEYMGHEQGIARFFAGINLFVAFMLILILGDSLWLLFIGWEGVGLASYLLIGFYYREPKAVSAAMKAFITTRIGDVFLIFAIFLCFFLFSTLDIASIQTLAKAKYPEGTLLITITVLCLLGGAVGKSAQLPLQTWLADAMWGPTPVSALIHAATMVTAGVYLLARMSGLIALSPAAQMAILGVGLLTMILAGFSALAQTDMKRVLAYSTMSQLGLMFLAVGAGAYQAAIFHLVTHAFFKALLFLSAGVIGHAIHTYDLTKMGGLRRELPGVFYLFLIGSLSLMGLPLVTAGFFSKEWIMGGVLSLEGIGVWAYALAVFGTFLTGFYTWRMMSLAFFGASQKAVKSHHGGRMTLPLLILALFSLGIGWLETPHILGRVHLMSDFLQSSLPKTLLLEESLVAFILPTIAALLGALGAAWRYRSGSELRRLQNASGLVALVKNGVGFDGLYSNGIVLPYQNLAAAAAGDVVKAFYQSVVNLFNLIFSQVRKLHTGRLSHYLSFMMVALVALASVMVFS